METDTEVRCCSTVLGIKFLFNDELFKVEVLALTYQHDAESVCCQSHF